MNGPLPGLTIDLIDDLFDLLRCFGRAVKEGPHLFVAVTRPKSMLVRISAVLGDKRMYITSRHDESPEGIPCLIQLGDPKKFVAWDTALSIEDAHMFISAVDQSLREFPGSFCTKGSRQRVAAELSERLFFRSVESTFVTAEDMMRVVQPSRLAVIREQFDKPDELVPFVDHFDRTFLCRLAHLDEIKRRDAAKMRVSMRRGISNADQLLSLPPEELESFFQEFVRELDRSPD
jgi:hypothetical protein